MAPSIASALPPASSLPLPLPLPQSTTNPLPPSLSPNIPWNLVGPANDHLLTNLEKLYWQGVKGELEVILTTLKAWQLPQYESVKGPGENDEEEGEDEEEGFVHGFDTFIDSVSQESRAFAVRYGKLRESHRAKKGKKGRETKVLYQDALHNRVVDIHADRKSSEIKYAIRQAIEGAENWTGIERRARMLLRSIGLLDIDKLIEYRPPSDKLPFWNRPNIPQLTLSKFDKHCRPILVPLRCSDCNREIRGCLFTRKDGSLANSICEDCYRAHHHGEVSYLKSYKHSILASIITPIASRRICLCSNVPHFDESGYSRSLFPVDQKEKHQNISGARGMQCGLLQLPKLVAFAKFRGMQSLLANGERPADFERDSNEVNSQKAVQEKKSEMNGWQKFRSKRSTRSSLVNTKERIATSETSIVYKEAAVDKDIPLFFRRYTQKYPFGNVHVSLRIGPLLIENGVPHTKGGALITLRDSPILQTPSDLGRAREKGLTVSGDTERTLWEQQRPKHKPKRCKAIMKQVIGVPFSGLLEQKAEREIVRDLIKASRRRFDDSGLHKSQQRKILDKSVENVLLSIRNLIGSRVRIYLTSIADQLVDINNNLGWSATNNNCQSFCNSLIKSDIFGPLLSDPKNSMDSSSGRLYLMSFFCPQESYKPPRVRNKFDVPSGLTEEYLLKFRYGRHEEADVIDTLQEYWHDWGAFSSPLYRFQDLFPWDCTEAYQRYPTTCGSCNLAKHVWAFPFDSWSIISLHLMRDRYMYTPTNPAHPQILSNEDWMRNRLILLTAQDVLTQGAVAMAQNAAFRASTRWLHSPERDKDKDQEAQAALARLKLGGIHRAQPYSHYFEQGTYHHFFIAEWAHLKRQDQVKAYELIRDGRARKKDLVYQENRFDGDDGDDGADCGGGGFDGGFGGDEGDEGGGGDGVGSAADGDFADPGSQGDAGFGDIGVDGGQANGDGDANCGSGCGADTASGAGDGEGGGGGGNDGGCAACGGCGGCGGE